MICLISIDTDDVIWSAIYLQIIKLLSLDWKNDIGRYISEGITWNYTLISRVSKEIVSHKVVPCLHTM